MRAVVFPGQASHRAGMAAAWEDHPAAVTFDEVARATGLRDLHRLADDPAACARTAVAQPAIFATSMTAWRALRDVGAPIDLVAGHSLGEVTAAVAAGVLTLADGARLVLERGLAFEAACRPGAGGMSVVLGLEREAVDEAVAGVPGVRVVNDNAPGQVVIAGPPVELDEAAARCSAAGARVRPLDVEGAFHTSAMTPAIVRMSTALRRLPTNDPAIPVVSASTLKIAVSDGEVCRSLVDGILAPVRWRELQLKLRTLGVAEIVEAGPGGVLRGLARRTVPDIDVVTIDGPGSLPRFVLEQLAER